MSEKNEDFETIGMALIMTVLTVVAAIGVFIVLATFGVTLIGLLIGLFVLGIILILVSRRK